MDNKKIVKPTMKDFIGFRGGDVNGDKIWGMWECPDCGAIHRTRYPDDEYYFCPNCGVGIDWASVE